MNFNYSSLQRDIEGLDEVEIDKHNKKYDATSPYHLRIDLRPCPFEGDLNEARVILLLANPHADTTTKPSDHIPINGWGVWGLSSNASAGMRQWWRPRVRHFINDDTNEEEWQALSTKVASFQAVAWASQQFHEANRLPSKRLMYAVMRELITSFPDKIFIVMRQRPYWVSLLNECNAKNVIHTKNSRCSYISEGNVDSLSNWEMLRSHLKN